MSTADVPATPVANAAAPPRRQRAGYIDWARGLAVLVMILGHVVDAWTCGPGIDNACGFDPRRTQPYFWFLMLAGMGAPMFLWLAGLAVPLAGHARVRRGASVGDASWTLQVRGWQIFGLALLFRLQAFIFSPGSTFWGMLKVDILNVMGLSLVAAGWLWGRSRRSDGRIALALVVTLVVLVLTPSLREWHWPGTLPDAVQGYLRPIPNRTTFTLFPWSAFVVAGLIVGELLATSSPAWRGPRLHAALLGAGCLLAVIAYWLSFQPTWLPGSRFWTTSPAFFAMRAGALMATLAALYFLLRPNGLWHSLTWPRHWSPMELLGRTSLFIYWVHVELVYGVFSRPLHRTLTFWQSLAGFAAFTLLMFGLAMLKTRYWDQQRPWARP